MSDLSGGFLVTGADDKSFGRRSGDVVLVDIVERLSRMEGSFETARASFRDLSVKMDKQIKLSGVIEDMMNRHIKMGERIGGICDRLTSLETHVQHIEERVESNSAEIKGHESPEEFLQKKSYSFLIAAGSALIGVIISKFGEIVDWFRGL